MKENLFRISFSILCFSFFGCTGGNETGDEVSQIQQYIKTTLKPKLQSLEEQVDTLETGGPISADGLSSVADQRITLLEGQLTQALETIQEQADRIFEMESQLAVLRGDSPPVPRTIRSTAASTVSPVSPVSAPSASPAVNPLPVPRVETIRQPSVNDAFFDSKVVQHYRQTYTSASSLTNFDITYKLGLHYESQGKLGELNSVDPTFADKYRQTKIITGRN